MGAPGALASTRRDGARSGSCHHCHVSRLGRCLDKSDSAVLGHSFAGHSRASHPSYYGVLFHLMCLGRDHYVSIDVFCLLKTIYMGEQPAGAALFLPIPFVRERAIPFLEKKMYMACILMCHI